MSLAKFFVAGAAAALTAIVAAISDDRITPGEWLGVLIAAAAALGVYLTPNKPSE